MSEEREKKFIIDYRKKNRPKKEITNLISYLIDYFPAERTGQAKTKNTS